MAKSFKNSSLPYRSMDERSPWWRPLNLKNCQKVVWQNKFKRHKLTWCEQDKNIQPTKYLFSAADGSRNRRKTTSVKRFTAQNLKENPNSIKHYYERFEHYKQYGVKVRVYWPKCVYINNLSQKTYKIQKYPIRSCPLFHKKKDGNRQFQQNKPPPLRPSYTNPYND